MAISSVLFFASPIASANPSLVATYNARDCQNDEPICISLKGGGVIFAGIVWSALAKLINLLKSLTRNVCG